LSHFLTRVSACLSKIKLRRHPRRHFPILKNDFPILGNEKKILGNGFSILGNHFLTLGNDKRTLGNHFSILGNDKITLGNRKRILGNARPPVRRRIKSWGFQKFHGRKAGRGWPDCAPASRSAAALCRFSPQACRYKSGRGLPQSKTSRIEPVDFRKPAATFMKMPRRIQASDWLGYCVRSVLLDGERRSAPSLPLHGL
jgi:hypothetical protein